MSIVYLAIGWVAGIWLAETLSGWSSPVWAGIAGLALLLAVLLRWSTIAPGRITLLIPALLILTALGAGGLRFRLSQVQIDESHVAFYNDQYRAVTLTGRVSHEPLINDYGTRVTLEAESIAVGDEAPRPVSGRVLVRASRFQELPYGSLLELQGRLETPENFAGFDYRAYLARQDIYSTISWPSLRVLDEGGANPLYRAIFTLKARAQAGIDTHIPQPEAGLLSGILLGNDQSMTPEQRDAFQATQMTHIIAISGFNIAILSGLLVRFTEPLAGRRGALWLTITGIALYTILVGADASVVRAAIMGSIYLVGARYLGRPTFALASLALAAILMTLFRPVLLWDAGFQLSFVATLSLLLYADPLTQAARRWLEPRFGRETTRRALGLLADTVLVTLAAQILTLPLTIALFEQISLVNLPANFLILPAQPGVMTWGGLATIGSLISPLLGEILGWVAWLFLRYTVVVNQALAQFSWAVIPMRLPAGALLSIYALILGGTWLARQEPQRLTVLAGRLPRLANAQTMLSFSVIALLLSWQWSISQPDGRLHVAFLDVGQGDAIFIQTPSGRQIFVDGGRYPGLLRSHAGRHIPFWDRTVDLVVATHPDEDHVGGLVTLFDRYRVERLLTNGTPLETAPAYSLLLQTADEAGAIIHPATAGETIIFPDGVRLDVLHPGPQVDLQNRNNNSVALRLTYGAFTLLLTGDAEMEGERAILQREHPVSALVFKAGHHGSATSSNDFFLAAVRPRYFVISVGEDNKFGHPAPAVLERATAAGATVLRTDELGTIEVITDGEQMWWQARR